MRTMFTYKCVDRLLREDDMQAAVVNALNKDFLGSHHLIIQTITLCILIIRIFFRVSNA